MYNEKNEIIAVCYYIHFPHSIKNIKLLSRLVVLPDYQGCGLGMKLINFVSQKLCESGFYAYAKTSSLAMIRGFNKSPYWICNSFGFQTGENTKKELNKCLSNNRKTASFRYVGENKEFLKLKR